MDHHRRRRGLPRPRILALSMLLALSIIAGVPTVATACALDGVVSIAVNGRPAAATPFVATAKTRATWAPFMLPSQAPGALLRLAEDRAKLRRSLPADVLTHPFRWDYGDGTTATAAQGLHRYGRPGLYKITVQGYWPARRTWTTFDSAQIFIVAPPPPTPLERIRAALLSGAIYVLPVASAAGVGLLIWGRRRGRTRREVRDDAPVA